MGVTPVKKTPSKVGRSPAQERRSQSRALRDCESPASLSQKTPNHIRDASFSHNLPTDEQKRSNGRVVGRSLIMWGRPRMAEKLLLHLHYECARHRLILPWDAIAHRLHPGSSGAAVVQHLNRVRKELVREGHLVPPICQKPSNNSIDQNIRGYVRQDPDGADRDATRPVRFDEKYDDLKFNLPDSFEHSGDDETSMPDSPSPIRMSQSRICGQAPSTTDESVTNSLHGFEQSWSPQSSFCSPTRQQRAEADELENPLLTRSFDTLTSAGSAPISAPTMPTHWQEPPWSQFSPMGMYPYSKAPTASQTSFPGYFTMPANFSMFPLDDPLALYQDHGIKPECTSSYHGESKHKGFHPVITDDGAEDGGDRKVCLGRQENEDKYAGC